MSKLNLEVAECDLPALRDVLRYSVMTDDQIARRYPDADFGLARLDHLWKLRLVKRWYETLEGAHVFSPTPRTRQVVSLPGVHPREVSASHLAHDVAVVDLADYLEQSAPGLRYVSESEIRPFLDQVASPPPHVWGDNRHRADGLLVDGTRCLAIELEHSDKSDERYRDISAWFIREMRIDGVRWYIDRPRILQRLRRVNAQHGFDRDMQMELLEFPQGLRVRKRRGKYEPWPG